MARAADDIEGQALDWLIRQREADFADWEGFAAWLAADPAHAETYHAVAAADAEMAELLASAPPPPPVAARPRPVLPSRRRWIGGAVAASLLALTGVSLLPRSAPYAVETAARERRTITLADGSRLALNGGTRILLDRRQDRIASVERGEVLFAIVHDPARPFRVTVGGASLVDVGTSFDVVRDGGATTVAVGEGAVVYNPDGEAVKLAAGRRLRTADGDSRIRLDDISPEEVGAWRISRLRYEGATIGEVAGDLSRNLGLRIVADPAVATQPFNGVIALDGPPETVVARLAGLTGVRARRMPDGWMLTASP